ncbi:unnamed protein product, partial [Closterium sp. Naga37s-1]
CVLHAPPPPPRSVFDIQSLDELVDRPIATAAHCHGVLLFSPLASAPPPPPRSVFDIQSLEELVDRPIATAAHC